MVCTKIDIHDGVKIWNNLLTFGADKETAGALAADGMLNIRTFGKRQVLMNQDDDADNVGVMLSGTAFWRV